MLSFTFYAKGHYNILATHKTTLEITKESHLTRRGDCIIAVNSECGIKDIPNDIKKAIRKRDSIVKMIIKVGDIFEIIKGFGHPDLSFSHPTDIVCRKSTYICPRTLMVKADKAAIDLNRGLIKMLKNPKVTVEITIIVESG